jgi:hypothetical protein
MNLFAMFRAAEFCWISRVMMLFLRVGLPLQQLEPLPGCFLLKRDLLQIRETLYQYLDFVALPALS